MSHASIYSYLLLKRRYVRQFLDASGLLVDAKWFVVHRYITPGKFGDQTAIGFTVNSVMILEQPDYEHYRSILDHLYLPVRNIVDRFGLGYRNWWRWLRVGEREKVKLIFSATGIARARIGYQIYVPEVLPSEGDKWVLHHLWARAARTLPFATLPRPSSF